MAISKYDEIYSVDVSDYFELDNFDGTILLFTY